MTGLNNMLFSPAPALEIKAAVRSTLVSNNLCMIVACIKYCDENTQNVDYVQTI